MLTGENLVANMDLIYWSVCSSSRRGEEEVNAMDESIVMLASCE